MSLVTRLSRILKQLLRVNPFGGDCQPSRLNWFMRRRSRPALPFPHPWNYAEPIRILDTYFWGADDEQGPGRHNRLRT